MRSEEGWVLQKSELKRLDREVLGVSGDMEVTNQKVEQLPSKGSDWHTDTTHAV
jgi:hypothetical protein